MIIGDNMSTEFNVFGQAFKPKNKFQSVLMSTLFLLFFAGVIYSFIILGLYNNDINDYSHTHEELKTYAPISNVEYDEESRLVYVFYEEAQAVNVYKIDGDFQWSVSIPKQRNGAAQFYLENGKIFLIWYDTYIYNAKTGEFIETHERTDDELDKADDFEENYSLEGTDLDYDIVDVYTVDKDGYAKNYIVNRPEYYILLNPIVGWVVSFASGLIIAFIAVIRALKSTKQRTIKMEKCRKFAKGFTIWFKLLIAVSVVYAVANIILLICSPIVILHVIFPIAVLFIVSGWVYAFVHKRFNTDERNMMLPWFIRGFIAFCVAFFSALIGTIVFG